jgi:SAM-dependent methyltransferase
MEGHQSLWLGEKELELVPMAPELGNVINQHAEDRQSKDDRAVWMADMIKQNMEGLEDEVKKFKNAPFTPYAHLWLAMLTKGPEKEIHSIDRLLKKLNGQTVLDLGCGRNISEFQGLIKTYGARNYLGVETHYIFGASRAARPIEGLGDVTYLDDEDGDFMDGAIIRGDMLRAVSRLPDSSVSVALNGIDDYVANSQTPYGARLADEVKRVLHPKGVCIGITANGGVLKALKQDDSLKTEIVPVPGASSDLSAGFYFISKT